MMRKENSHITGENRKKNSTDKNSKENVKLFSEC